MLRVISKLLSTLKNKCKTLSALIKSTTPIHAYRVISIEKNKSDDYLATIQIVNKNQMFQIKPEEILANNKLVDSFSQKDVRALTYLGYLGINNPRYTILAKRLSENDNKLFFAIKERGSKKPIIKTADQISADEQLLKGLHQKDAHMIGYATAAEQVKQEKRQKILTTKKDKIDSI